MNHEHQYIPDVTAPGYCTCGLPKRNRWHTDPLPVLPALHEGRARTGVDHPDTSRQAAATVTTTGTLTGVRRELVDLIADASTGSLGGMTDDELEVATGRPHQTVSATRNGLVRDGYLTRAPLAGTDTTRTRPTRSGKPATVWTLTPAAADLTGATP